MRPDYRPAYFFLEPLPVRRSRPPAREAGWYGRLEIEVTCLSSLHVGSGVPARVQFKGQPTLVEGFATLPADPKPERVVPGSSVKGAVRAIIEALTPSCERTGKDACEGRKDLCPACALLGAPGWRGTVAFSDLRPIPGAHTVAARRIAQRYSHRNAPARGRRLYGPQPESPLPQDKEVLLVLAKDSRLAGEIVAVGATEEGLGILTLALGLPPSGLPYLRLGGGKNRGIGIVRVSLQAWNGGQGIPTSRRSLDPGDDVVGRWQERALAAYPEVKDRADRIRANYATS